MSNLLLALIFASLAVGFVLLFNRGWKPKVIEFSGTPQVKPSTQARVVAAPTETRISDGEPGSLKHDWQPEMQLRYPGSTELNRIYTTLRRTIKLENVTQDGIGGGVQETIRLVSDAVPDLIFTWYREQLTSRGWQPADDSRAVGPVTADRPDARPSTRRYVRNEDEFCVAIDDPGQVGESLESLWKNVAVNLTVSKVQLQKIVGDNPGLIETLQHVPSLEGKTVFEIRYSKKS